MASGALVALGLAAAAPVVGHADDPLVDMSIGDGWKGTVDGGSWLPVTVTLRNRSGHDVRGQVVLTVQGPAGSSSQCFANGNGVICRSFGSGVDQAGSPADYALPVALAPGVTKTLEVTVLAGASSVKGRLLDEGGAEVTGATQELDISFGSQRTLVAVVSTDGGALDGLASGQSIQVIHLRPADLPSSSIPLTSFDAVVLDRAPTDTLTADQRQALADFVGGGGTLIVMGGSDAKATLAGLPQGLVPVTVQGSTTIQGMPELTAMTGATRLDARIPVVRVLPHGAVALREAGQPILVVARRGLGTVAFSAVDPGAEPLASWVGDAALLRRLVLRALAVPAAHAVTTSFNGSPGGDVRATLASETGPVGQAVGNIPGISLPAAAVLGLMLLGYIFLAGPLSYIVLRGIGRRDLMWVTVPVLSVAAAGLAYATGLGTSGRGLTVDEIRILHLQPGSDRATVDAFVDAFAAHGGSHEIRLGGSPYVTSLSGGAGELTVRAGDSPVTAELRHPAASVTGFSSTRTAELHGRLDADLHDNGGTTTGTVTNRLDVDLEDAYIVEPGGQATSLGDLPRGQTLHVNADHSVASSLYPPGGVAVPVQPLLGGNPADRRQFQRQQLLSALQTAAPMAGQGRPVLVALAASPLLATDLGGDSLDTTVLDAVMLPLAADVAGSVNGLEAPIIDRGDSSAASGSDGSWAVYQASLPGASWRSLSVSVDQSCSARQPCLGTGMPPVAVAPKLLVPTPIGGGTSGSGSASAGGSAQVIPNGGSIAQSTAATTVQAFDVRTQAWTVIGTVGGSTQQLTLDNARDFVDSDGNLWIRVVQAAGSFSPTATVRVTGTAAGGQS